MKTLVIGDIHGRVFWKSLVQKYSVDKVVFVGDYVDSFNLSIATIIQNLNEIIYFVRGNAGKVELLLGNHDIQYIFNPRHRCSGFEAAALFDYQLIFRENRDLFKAAHYVGDYLISHAGVTQKMFSIIKDEYEMDIPIDLKINYAYEKNFEPLFWIGRLRGGIAPTPGIFWADKKELIKNPLSGYNQIVGHTPIREVHDVETAGGHILKFIDTSSENSFFIIE